MEFVHKGETVVYLTKLPAGVSRLELILVNKWTLMWGNIWFNHCKNAHFLPCLLISS